MKAEGAIWPTGLKPGDKVRFVSPASTPDRDNVFQRARKLECWGLRADYGQHAFKKRSYLAGTDEVRVADFNAALRDPEVRDLRHDRYDLPEHLTVRFLRRGFNDSFEVRTGSTTLGVLRLSGSRVSPESVKSETNFLAFLDKNKLPIAAPIPTHSGELSTQIETPDGMRSVVLFHYVEGGEPGHHPAGDAKAQGISMARINAAAGTFPHWNVGGHRLDLDHLLHHPLASVLALELLDDVSRESLSALASKLSSAVAAIGGLTWVRCHGDCHGGNARISRDGPLKGQAIFFDFDDDGPGFLAYDLAVFLWSVSLQREGYSQWQLSSRDIGPFAR